jgi:hypothetical protein
MKGRLKRVIMREIEPIADLTVGFGNWLIEFLIELQDYRFRWYHFIVPLILAFYIGHSMGRDSMFRELEKYIPEEVIWDSMDYWEGREALDGPDDSMEWP